MLVTAKDMLDKAGILYKTGILTDRSLRISEYDSIKRLPGYRDGFFTVQDETSTYAVTRAGIKAGDRVLDMCASPGGKSILAYELTVSEDRSISGKVVSCDISEAKLRKIKENADRIGIPAGEGYIPAGIEVRMADAAGEDYSLSSGMMDSSHSDDEERFDVVIADVPCSGLGIIGRKNDIKYHMTPDKMRQLSEQGIRILRNASKMVKDGGTICYSTCTINPAENGDVVRRFLGEQTGGRQLRIAEERTFLQGVDGSDGFYYCILC